MKDSFNEYRKFHWGDQRTKVVRLNNHIIPDQNPDSMPRFSEIGRLIEFRLVDFNQDGINYIFDCIKNNKQPKNNLFLSVDDKEIDECFLVYDKNIKNEPIFVSLSDKVKRKSSNIYKTLKNNPISISDLCFQLQQYGFKGKQFNTKYEKEFGKVKVKPIGFVTDGLYKTFKNGHGLSFYIHAFGEPYGAIKKWSMQPVLGVDIKGNLWLIGGNYRCVPAGIIN